MVNRPLPHGAEGAIIAVNWPKKVEYMKVTAIKSVRLPEVERQNGKNKSAAN